MRALLTKQISTNLWIQSIATGLNTDEWLIDVSTAYGISRDDLEVIERVINSSEHRSIINALVAGTFEGHGVIGLPVQPDPRDILRDRFNRASTLAELKIVLREVLGI